MTHDEMMDLNEEFRAEREQRQSQGNTPTEPTNPTPATEPGLTPDEMRRFALSLFEQATTLFAQAQQAESAAPAAEPPAAKPEPLVRFDKDEIDRNGYVSFDSQRRRKAWLLIGLLVDSGLITMPSFDVVGDRAKIATCDHMSWLYDQIEGSLELMDKA